MYRGTWNEMYGIALCSLCSHKRTAAGHTQGARKGAVPDRAITMHNMPVPHSSKVIFYS